MLLIELKLLLKLKINIFHIEINLFELYVMPFISLNTYTHNFFFFFLLTHHCIILLYLIRYRLSPERETQTLIRKRNLSPWQRYRKQPTTQGSSLVSLTLASTAVRASSGKPRTRITAIVTATIPVRTVNYFICNCNVRPIKVRTF